MNCKEFADFLIHYLEGDLPPEQAEAFDEHLQLCPPCIHYLEAYRHCVKLSKVCCSEHDKPVPEEVPDELINAILAARKKSP